MRLVPGLGDLQHDPSVGFLYAHKPSAGLGKEHTEILDGRTFPKKQAPAAQHAKSLELARIPQGVLQKPKSALIPKVGRDFCVVHLGCGCVDFLGCIANICFLGCTVLSLWQETRAATHQSLNREFVPPFEVLAREARTVLTSSGLYLQVLQQLY